MSLKLTNPLSNFFLSQIVNDGIMLEMRQTITIDVRTEHSFKNIFYISYSNNKRTKMQNILK
jgi:hypothetical protein